MYELRIHLMVCETYMYVDAFTWSNYYFLLEFIWGSDWGLCQTSWWGTDLQKKQNDQLVLPVAVCDFRYWGELIFIITQLWYKLMFDLLKGCMFKSNCLQFLVQLSYLRLFSNTLKHRSCYFLMLKTFMNRLIF